MSIISDAIAMSRFGQNPADGINDGNRLQMAHAMSVARSQQGQSASPQDFGGTSPLTRSITAAKSLIGSSLLGEDSPLEDHEKDQLKQMQTDPSVDYHSFANVVNQLAQQRKAAKKNAPPQPHQFETPPAKQGTIDVTQGTGPNRMSDAAFGQFQNRVQDNADFAAPGTRGIATGPGFIHEQTESANPSADADPIVSLVNSVKGKVSDQAFGELKAFANAGANAQQLHTAMQHDEDTQSRQATADARQQGVAARGKQRMQLGVLQHQMPVLQQQMKALENQYFGIEGANDAKAFSGGDPNAASAFNVYQTLKAKRETLQANMEKLAGGGEEGAADESEQPTAGGKPLDPATAHQLYQQAGGDPQKARVLARQMGFTF